MNDKPWQAGDWAVFDRDVVQIKEIMEGDSCSVSNGWVETSGKLLGRLRPLTLRNKRTVEHFEIVYNRLRQLRGEIGFNYPDISRYFSELCLQAIDGPEDSTAPHDKAHEFVALARDYTPVIHGIHLFRK